MRASWSQLAERGVSGHRLRAFARHHAVPPVRCCLFVDAALPARARHTPAAPTELLDFLRGKMTDGRLPPWTAWWDEDVAPLFPDAATRAAVTAEELRLPFAYYEQSVPVPAGWDDDVACDNLLFGPPYEGMAPTLAAEVGLSRSLPDSSFTSSSTQRPPLTG